MSGDGDIACYTNSLDARESSRNVLVSNNLYCLADSGERRALRVVVELDLEDVVNVVGVGSDAVIEDVEVYAFGGRSGEELHHGLILELKRRKEKMEKKTVKVKKESTNVKVIRDMMKIGGE
ncbi:hypothetical protein AHAS_Ahas15G0338900 [Arachis hypogaea]